MPTPFEKLEAEVRNLRREIRRLKGDPNTENEAAVEELVGDSGEANDERQAGRHTGGGWAAVAKEACRKADVAQAAMQKKIRAHRGW